VGITYPFQSAGISPLPKPGTLDFRVLDTNNDGSITQLDDPYTPYCT
jgi:hypothetical protein